MLWPIPYTPKQETIKQVCSTERAWMELLPQMGNVNWGPIWCNNIVSSKSDLSVKKNEGHPRVTIFAIWFQRRNFLEYLTIYGHGGHLGLMTMTVWTNFQSYKPWKPYMKFGFNGPSSFAADVWKYKSEWHWTKVKQWSWPLVLICIHVLTYCTSLCIKRTQV